MATDLGQLVWTLTLQSEGFQGQLNSASEKVKSSSSQMTGAMKETEEQSKKTGGAFSGMAAQFVAGQAIFEIGKKALEGLKNVLKDGVKNFEDWQLNQAQINNALKTTKDVSGQTTKSLNEYADSLSSQTGITANAINQAQLMLLKYTSIGKDVFPGATKATADLATAMSNGAVPGTEAMTAASKLLGVALSDPEQSFGRLKKAGVVLTDQQKEQIKTMQAAGNVAGAQKAILDDLAGSIGGKAVTASHTLAGEQAQLHAQLEKVEIQVGQKLTAAFKAIEPYLVKFANWVMEHKAVLGVLAGVIGSLALIIGGAMVVALWSAVTGFLALDAAALPWIAAAAAIGATIALVIIYWKKWHQEIAALFLVIFPFIGIAMEIVANWTTLKKWFNEFWSDIKKWFHDGVDDIKRAWDVAWHDIKQVVVDVVHAIGLVLTPFYDVFKFIFETEYAIAMWVWHGIYNDAVKPIMAAIVAVLRVMGEIASAVWHGISDVAIGAFNAIWGFVRPIVAAIWSVMVDAWHIVSGVWSAAYGFFANLFGGISNAGSHAANSISGFFGGIWNGIKGAARDAVNYVIGVLDNMIKAYNSTVGKIPGAPKLGSIPKFASGVTNFGGGLALVGEQGPELAYLPPGSNVYNNNQTQKMLQGNSYNFGPGSVILSTKAAVDEFFSIGNRSTQLELQGGSPLAGTTRV